MAQQSCFKIVQQLRMRYGILYIRRLRRKPCYLISVLCVSFFIVCERQLFDFLHGKWAAEQSEEIHRQTASVARNNDISERDFSALDRLLRSKSTANMDFIEGLILYVNNKTGQYLQILSASELHNEIAMAMKGARKHAKLYKEKKKNLREQRKEEVLNKQKHRERNCRKTDYKGSKKYKIK